MHEHSWAWARSQRRGRCWISRQLLLVAHSHLNQLLEGVTIGKGGRAEKRQKREQAGASGHMVWSPRLTGIVYPRILSDGKEAAARIFYEAKGV